MSRTRLFDTLILIILLIGVSTFPTGFFVKDLFWYYVIEALLMLLVLLFIFYFERRNPEIVPPRRRFNLTNFLLFLPCFIITFSNLIYAFALREPAHSYFELYSIPQACFIILNVVVEEIIFRKHLLGNLAHPKPIVRILISASIFALCHLTAFLSTFNPATLIVVVYSFGLGMVLGFLYVYTGSLYPCIGLHLLFNLINEFLFEGFYGVSNPLWYYLINIFVGLVIGIYILVLYLVKLRKNHFYLN